MFGTPDLYYPVQEFKSPSVDRGAFWSALFCCGKGGNTLKLLDISYYRHRRD